MRSTRLLTLVGPGGSGKTRLAIEIARSAKNQRAVWVDLAPIRDGAQIAPVIERAVGNGGGEGLLLLLDGCEHVAAAVADATGRLLVASSDTTVLTTSREPLNLEGELLWRVPGLAVPTEEEASDPARCVRSDAVRLFVERARLVRQDFAFDALTAGHVVAICRRLDGLPLALELAAARLRHFSLATIEELLAHPLQLLAGRDGGFDPRHHTIRATLDWSYGLLTDDERALLRHLAVFASSFSLEGAAAVYAGEGGRESDVAEILGALVDKSLVDFEQRTLRYALLEPIREYAMEHLRASAQDGLALERLATFLTRLFDRELPVDRPPRDASSESRVRAEFFNVAAVLPSLARSDPPHAVALVLRFARFPWTMVPIHVGVVDEWLGESLSAHRARDEMRALGLAARARILCDLDRLPAAVDAAAEALSIAVEIGSPPLTGAAQFISAYVAIAVGDLERGRNDLDDSIPALAREDTLLVTRALNLRAILRARLGDHVGAEADIREALAVWDTTADKGSAMRYQTHLVAGDIAYRRGDTDLAIARLRKAIEWQRTALTSWAGAFDLLAHVLAERGRSEDALRLAGFVDRQLGERGLWPDRNFALADRAWLGEIGKGLGDRGLRLIAEGRLMSTDRAFQVALGDERGPLSKREVSIAAMVGEGHSDREIAARLVISERTVENHVRHIREKLALRSRAQIGRWLAENASRSNAEMSTFPDGAHR